MKATDQASQARSTFEPFEFEDVTLTEVMPSSVRAQLRSIDLKSLQRKGLALKKFEQNFEAEVDTSLDFEDFTLTDLLTREFPAMRPMLISSAMEVTSMELSLDEGDAPPPLPLTLRPQSMRPKSTPPPAPTSDDDAWLATLPEETRLELEAVRDASTRWPLAPRLNHAVATPVGQS